MLFRWISLYAFFTLSLTATKSGLACRVFVRERAGDPDEHAAVEAAKQEADKAQEDKKLDPDIVELYAIEEEASAS